MFYPEYLMAGWRSSSFIIWVELSLRMSDDQSVPFAEPYAWAKGRSRATLKYNCWECLQTVDSSDVLKLEGSGVLGEGGCENVTFLA